MNRYYVELDNGTVLYVYAYSPEQVKNMLMTYEIVALDQTDQEVSTNKQYKIRDVEDGSIWLVTLPMILEELNRDRSEEWTNYDETDWREGLAEFTTYEVMEDEHE